MTVSGRPALAGIDPHYLLDPVENGDDDNIEVVSTEGEQVAAMSRKTGR